MLYCIDLDGTLLFQLRTVGRKYKTQAEAAVSDLESLRAKHEEEKKLSSQQVCEGMLQYGHTGLVTVHLFNG